MNPCLSDGRQPWILWWKRTWKLIWPAGTFRNMSKRILSLSTWSIFLNEQTRRSVGEESALQRTVGVAAQQKELPGIVELCLKWTPGMTHPTAETSVSRVLGQQVSQVCTPWRKRTQKLWFSAITMSRFNQSGSLLPPSKTSKMHFVSLAGGEGCHESRCESSFLFFFGHCRCKQQ